MDRQRRRIIQVTGAALAGVVAGCSSGGSDGTDTDDGGADTDSEMSGTDTEAEMGMTDSGMGMTDSGMGMTDSGMGTATDSGMGMTDSGMGTTTDSGMGSTAELTMSNVGASAWEVTAGADAVSAMGENPTLTLSAGTRYVVQNDGWSAHPLAFRAADDSPLLSQSADGSYESDDAVNWVDNETSVEFTVTEELAADLDYYICTVHSAMRGSVETA